MNLIGATGMIGSRLLAHRRGRLEDVPPFLHLSPLLRYECAFQAFSGTNVMASKVESVLAADAEEKPTARAQSELHRVDGVLGGLNNSRKGRSGSMRSKLDGYRRS